jgi:hypothetical protein
MTHDQVRSRQSSTQEDGEAYAFKKSAGKQKLAGKPNSADCYRQTEGGLGDNQMLLLATRHLFSTEQQNGMTELYSHAVRGAAEVKCGDSEMRLQ